jgi:hypothetical protein
MNNEEMKKRTIRLKMDIKTTLNAFIIETGLTVTGVDIRGILMDYSKGYGLIDDISIGVKL